MQEIIPGLILQLKKKKKMDMTTYVINGSRLFMVHCRMNRTSVVVQTVENPPAMQEIWV